MAYKNVNNIIIEDARIFRVKRPNIIVREAEISA